MAQRSRSKIHTPLPVRHFTCYFHPSIMGNESRTWHTIAHNRMGMLENWAPKNLVVHHNFPYGKLHLVTPTLAAPPTLSVTKNGASRLWTSHCSGSSGHLVLHWIQSRKDGGERIERMKHEGRIQPQICTQGLIQMYVIHIYIYIIIIVIIIIIIIHIPDMYICVLYTVQSLVVV